MRQHFYILTIAFLLTACNQNGSTNTDNKPADTLSSTNLLGKSKPDPQEPEKKRLSFKDVAEIVADSSYSTWVESQDSSASLALHFQDKDALGVSYSPECWLTYPYKLDGHKIVVYWDNNIDTKYDFDIVKAVNYLYPKGIGVFTQKIV